MINQTVQCVGPFIFFNRKQHKGRQVVSECHVTNQVWTGVVVRKRSAQLSALKPTTEGATGLGFGGAGQ
jgi:hypothetical protein